MTLDGVVTGKLRAGGAKNGAKRPDPRRPATFLQVQHQVTATASQAVSGSQSLDVRGSRPPRQSSEAVGLWMSEVVSLDSVPLGPHLFLGLANEQRLLLEVADDITIVEFWSPLIAFQGEMHFVFNVSLVHNETVPTSSPLGSLIIVSFTSHQFVVLWRGGCARRYSRTEPDAEGRYRREPARTAACDRVPNPSHSA